jgi:PAS domain-containing protein
MTSAISHQDLSDLIGRIYDCTLEPSRWKATVDAMRSLIEGADAQLALIDVRQYRYLVTANVGLDARSLEEQALYTRNIYETLERVFDDGLSMDEPLIVTRAMSAAALAACPYVQEWVRPRGLVDAAQLHLMRTPERIAVLAFERHESVGFYGDREVEILRLLLPHVRRAVTISNVLDVQAIEKARMAETLDALKLGVVLANEDSRILHANRVAEEMMRDGGAICDRLSHRDSSRATTTPAKVSVLGANDEG